VAALAWAPGRLAAYSIFSAAATRDNKLDEQLPEALDLISRAMRGHAFWRQMVAEESQDPTASEFRMTFEEINYGIAVKDALMNLATRVPSSDLRYFVIAVLIQRETGGNLAELLGNISALIRARFKLLGTVRVLSAEGRLSAWILTLLPCVRPLHQFAPASWNPVDGCDRLEDVATTLALMAFGIFWMWRIVKIHV
jgi:tight adherence protein B